MGWCWGSSKYRYDSRGDGDDGVGVPSHPAACAAPSLREREVFLGAGFAVGGKEDGDLGALVDLTGNLGAACVGFDDTFDDGEAETETVSVLEVGPVERLEDGLEFVGGNADAGVFDPQGDHVVAKGSGIDADGALVGVLDGVSDEVFDQAGQQHTVSLKICRETVHIDEQTFAGGERHQAVHDVGGERQQIQVVAGRGDQARVAEGEEVVAEVLQVLNGALHSGQGGAVFGWWTVPFEGVFEVGGEGGDGASEFV